LLKRRGRSFSWGGGFGPGSTDGKKELPGDEESANWGQENLRKDISGKMSYEKTSGISAHPDRRSEPLGATWWGQGRMSWRRWVHQKAAGERGHRVKNSKGWESLHPLDRANLLQERQRKGGERGKKKKGGEKSALGIPKQERDGI